MKKWESLNMELRNWVIAHALRLEQASSDALCEILRVYDHDSRTLGNQSKYALSFKTKIDLLYDLGEIDKPMYPHLIKLMEIRNQFAHNPTVISFVSPTNQSQENILRFIAVSPHRRNV